LPETSGCQLSVGDLILFAAALPDDELVSSFRESDRRQSGDARESCIYQCPVKQLCDRLDVMGFTLADAERSMREFVRNQVSLELRYFVGLREPTSEGPRKTSQNVGIDLLNRSTFEQWREAYVRLTNEWCRGASVGSSEHNPLDKHLYDFRHEERDAPIVGIRSPFGSIRSGLRVSLSAFEATAEARLDCSRLVAEEWIDADVKLTEVAIDRLLAPARASEPIIVLTEGATDTRILSRSLQCLYPHLRGCYTFLDHEGFSTQSGTGGLGHLVKGLAASGMSNRVIAVFDNDTAGAVGVDVTQKQKYPKNFRILLLPPLERARSYPTLGPSGPVEMDINGKACSLELYLGPGALTGEDDALIPVHWTGYESRLRQYQGVLLNKVEVQKRFLERLEGAAVGSTAPEFDDMRAVLRMIMNAFAC
jgi:hypothetical protein